MLVVRALYFVAFIVLTLALVAWQGITIWDLASLGELTTHPWGATLSAIMLGLLGGELFVSKRFGKGIASTCGWLFAIALYAGLALAIGMQAYLRLTDTQPEGLGTSWFEVNVGSGIVAFLGSIPLILGRGFNLKRLRNMAGVVIAIVGVNLVLPVQLGALVDAEVGMKAGLAAIALQFFVIVDFFLFRSLMHYFGNGATTFVSLRYLRKRPVSLASVLGVASGICVLIVVNSIMNGFANDYRLQIRSTLSDVMVKVDSSALMPTRREVDAEMWAQCWNLVQRDSERALPAWQNALAAAQDVMRRQVLKQEPRIGYQPGEVQFTKDFPRARKPEEEPNPVIAKWLNQLNSPEGVLHRNLLNCLPELEFCGQVNPITVWFHTREMSDNDRQAAMEDLRVRCRDALFMPNLEEGLGLVGRSAQFRHPVDTSQLPFNLAAPQTGPVSYRLQNHTAITAGGYRTDFSPATITAIDPIAEPQVSRIGDFLQEAAFQDFVSIHHIDPMIDFLGGLLILEVEAEAQSNSLSHVRVKDVEGKRIRFISPSADESSLYYRGMVDSGSKLNWPAIDQVKFRPELGGEALRSVLRNAIRSAKKVQRPNMARLEVIAFEAYEKATRIIEERIQAIASRDPAGASAALESASANVETWLRPANDLYEDAIKARLSDPGDLGLLLYLRDYRLRTLPSLVRETSARLKDTQLVLAESTATANAEELTPPAGLVPLLDAVNASIDNLIRVELRNVTSAEELRALVRTRVNDLIAKIDAWYASDDGQRKALRAYSKRIDTLLRNIIAESYLPSKRTGKDSTLEGILLNWPTAFAQCQRVMQAYATHLPTKTRLLESESVLEYQTRAEAMLGFRPSNALWADSPAMLEHAKDGALAIANVGFATHRLSETTPEGIKPALWKEVSTRLRTKAADSELVRARGKLYASVSAIQQDLEDLRISLRSELEDFLQSQELDGDQPKRIREHFAVLSEDEYWLLRPQQPGVILGDAMAKRLRIGEGDNVRALVMRLSEDESEGTRRNMASTFAGTGEQEFRVNALFRSGLFQENATNIYGDFDTWKALLGASRAQYIVAFNLKNSADYAGQPANMVELLKFNLRHNVRAEMQAMEKPSDALSRANNDMRRFFDVTSWEIERDSLLKAVEQEKRILTLLLTLIVVLAGVVILIVVYLTVIEKIKDIGILRALGASPWGIRSIFMFNALFIGLFGTITGSALAILISQNLNSIEDWVDNTFGVRLFPPDIYYLVYIPSVKGADLWWLAMNIAVPSTLWAFFCGIFPAVIASKKETIEALHYE